MPNGTPIHWLPEPAEHPTSMKCPHCTIAFHDNPKREFLGRDPDGHWLIEIRRCPECQKEIYTMICAEEIFQNSANGREDYYEEQVRLRYLIRPRGVARQPLPQGVPPSIAEDYKEAALVLADSAKASAALSRRCLQHFIREVLDFTKPNLAQEIDEVIASGVFPSNINDELDKVRIIGNFAAHPEKSTSTGVILAVEPGEAEWNLDVLDNLFDFYYIRLARSAELKANINKKLIAAGKTPLP